MNKTNRFSRRLTRILSSRSGETLIEGVVSFVILSMLVVTVTAMIVTATRMTSTATSEAIARQAEANEAAMGNLKAIVAADGNPETDNSDETLTLSGGGFHVSIEVTVTEGEYYTVFDAR